MALSSWCLLRNCEGKFVIVHGRKPLVGNGLNVGGQKSGPQSQGAFKCNPRNEGGVYNILSIFRYPYG